MEMKGRVLVIAGSDSGGGAGIQADVKAITALGGFAMTAITALTAQNTRGVQSVLPIAPDFIQAQMRSVLTDLGADVIKIGMLHDADVINAVADVLEELAPGVPLILDPVMVAKGGAVLLEQNGLRHMKIRLLPMTTLLTPNIPEAQLMAGMDITNAEQRHHAATMMLTLGAKTVLLKGGHASDTGDTVVDLLVGEGLEETLVVDRIASRNTHGTGCTLASAIACGVAQGMTIPAATERAHAYVHEAILHAPGFGHGHGPLNHAVTVAPFPRSV